jgi:hypothetical protein
MNDAWAKSRQSKSLEQIPGNMPHRRIGLIGIGSRRPPKIPCTAFAPSIRAPIVQESAQRPLRHKDPTMALQQSYDCVFYTEIPSSSVIERT